MIRIFAFLLAALAVLAQAPPASSARDLTVTIGKSVLVDSPPVIERVAVGNASLVEAIAITPHEVLVNGKAVGETTMIVWQEGGNRLFFDLTVTRNDSRFSEVRRQIAEEPGDENVELEYNGDTIFLRGTAASVTAADRAIAIASTFARTVNLMRISVPPTDAQILLKVRFADVDRSASENLGINIVNTDPRMPVAITTGQATPPSPTGSINAPTFTLSQALNVFLFRPDLNIGATIAALQGKNLLQILAEPNVLAINGHAAEFLSGGQFPYPTVQGGANAGAVTIAYREFGVKIAFTPVLTPRGTIRLSVTPEVSTLDYANGLVFQGYTVPGIDTRRIQTEIELNDGQTFAIGGLLDNRTTETLSKIPGLASIPFFGKLFQSRIKNKSNSELLVLVTPELVNPIPKGMPTPDLTRPTPFLPSTGDPTRTPGVDVTGASIKKPDSTLPMEELMKSMLPTAQQGPQTQYAPGTAPPATAPPGQTPGAPPAGQPAPAAPAAPRGTAPQQ